MNLPHDPFCRGVLADVPTFLEFIRYLTTKDAELNDLFNLLDQASFRRMPGDYSDTESKGYADLAFLANVKQDFQEDCSEPVQFVGFLVEHKSARDNNVLEQLRRYNFHLMVQKLKDNVFRGIPSIAIILYNGKENWDPLKELYANKPKKLQRLMLPFQCIMLDVNNVSDEELDGFNARLAAFIGSLKYVRDPESKRDLFKRIIERVLEELPKQEALDLLHQMDVYLHGWLRKIFMEAYKMDFVRPNYKTIADGFYEEGEKRRAEETARRMLAKNKPIEEIIEFTDLSKEEVEALKK